VSDGGHRVAPLAGRQRAVLELIQAYYRVAARRADPPRYRYPSVAYLAARLGLHPTTVQDHLEALYRKGWLRTPQPAGLRCPHLPDTTESP